jgi:G8 domain
VRTTKQNTSVNYKSKFWTLQLSLLASAILAACGGGLVEPPQPAAPVPTPTSSAQATDTPVSAESLNQDSLQELARSHEIEEMLVASRAYNAAAAIASKSNNLQQPKMVLADITSASAALFDKKSLLSVAKTPDSTTLVTAPSPLPVGQPAPSILGSTFDYLSAQVASLTAKVGLGTVAKTGSDRRSVILPPTPAPAPSPTPSTPPAAGAAELRWSDLATWGGTLPSPGADIVIPAGRTIIVDTSPAAIGALRVEGTLKFEQRDIDLKAASINVTGSFQIGSPTEAYRHKAVITLTGAPGSANDGVARGINVEGGQLALYGTAPSPVWTKLNANASANSTNFVLRDSTNWKSGDVIAMAPTDFYGVSQTERFTLTRANGTGVSTNAGIAQARWGVLQYVTSNGMSLTPEPGYTPPALPAPTVLDQRAAVGNLSRNIVIQSADDDAWRNNGFGVHLMFMGLNSKVVLDGVEIHRAGQAGITGRYPIHWHRLSYSDAGVALGDAVGHVVQNSTVWESANRCVVIHATNGVSVKNNICQDVKGHAFFLEDAVERRNVFDGNLALFIRRPTEANKLQVHEGDVYQAGSSGFWLTNPDNTVINNLSADAIGNGFWLAFPEKALGLSAAVNMLPNHLPHGSFENNTAHSNKGPGVLMNHIPIDAAGNLGIARYEPTSDESADKTKKIRFELKKVTSYKNMDGAYKNVSSSPDYTEWVTADNYGVHISGSLEAGTIQRGLFIGESLNNATPYPTGWPYEAASAFATYHSAVSIFNNTVINFPFVEGKTSGMFKADDYYLLGIDKGQARNTNNRLLNTQGGYKPLPPNLDGQPLENRNWTYSGALWDPQGIWGAKANYLVYDVPFLTAGGSCQTVVPAAKQAKSCTGEYYGVESFQTDFDDPTVGFVAPMEVIRKDAAGSEIGRWAVGDGITSTKLSTMRHFAARPGGTYTVRFPGRPLPRSIALNVSNAYRIEDSFLFAVPFDGKLTASGYTLGGDHYNRFYPKTYIASGQIRSNVRLFKTAFSLNEVSQSTGDKIWQDVDNNLVWIRFQGGLPLPNESNMLSKSDQDLYRTYSVVIYPK